MRNCDVIRVFTRAGRGGNHLGVVTDLSGLETDGMQAIAAELGFSETVFVGGSAGGAIPVRIFTPAREMPFAGHPLVGAAWFLEDTRSVSSGVFATGVGEVGFETSEGVGWITPPFNQDVVEGAVGPPEWTQPQHSSTVRMPLEYQVVEFDSVDVVAGLGVPSVADSIYAWAWVEADVRVRARFFAREHGVVEDPATGSAAVALAASLKVRGITEASVVIHQGEEMGHPSQIQLSWTGDTVRVGGVTVRDEVRILDV